MRTVRERRSSQRSQSSETGEAPVEVKLCVSSLKKLKTKDKSSTNSIDIQDDSKYFVTDLIFIKLNCFKIC
jgi:hypothetical protein